MNEIAQLFKILGFANRARKLTLGMSATMSSLTKQKVKAVLLAADISENTAEKIRLTAKQMQVSVYDCSSKADFGKLFNRNEVGIIGIADSSFAKAIAKILK